MCINIRSAHMSVDHMPSALRYQKMSDPLEIKLQTDVIYQVGAGNQTQLL